MTISTEHDIADGRVFENSANGHREYVGITATFGMFFLGFLYLAYKGLWTHAVIVIVLMVGSVAAIGEPGLLVAGLVWLIYTFAARKIVADSYLRKGWVEVTHEYPRDGRAPIASPPVDDHTDDDGVRSVADELAKLVGLRDAGHLTQQEFDAQKARLLK